ncbi:hypothetical protein LCI18_004596 [Fusarium solani-melongenae]|uniref:Uncharacterized protein n=1 Tax=Fusarium solani subsp. cucurbitae TaxID=2747967 RepID=A0ACD3YXP5_FUSSC|nr:hypothetical protein LCI18_004596 [Fusarium solani-melongenae]
MSDDRAHLAAMGFPDPRIPTLKPEPETTADRAQAIQIPRLTWGMTAREYADRRANRQFGQMAVDLAFRGQRRRHKVMQYLHNDISREYFVRMDEYDPSTSPRDRMPICLGWRISWGVTGSRRNVSELVSLLDHSTWGYGYFTLRTRRTHEGHARRARRAAIEWPKVAKMLRDAEAEAMTARIVARRKDLEIQRPRI